MATDPLTPEQALEMGDIVLKGLLVAAVVAVVQTLIRKWRSHDR